MVVYEIILGVIIFGSVRFLLKKVTKPKFYFLKKNRNQFKLIGFGSVFYDKNRFKPVWFGFFCLARFFSGLARFFFYLSLIQLFFSDFLTPVKYVKYRVSKMHGGNSRLPIKETTKKDT